MTCSEGLERKSLEGEEMHVAKECRDANVASSLCRDLNILDNTVFKRPALLCSGKMNVLFSAVLAGCFLFQG